MRVRCEALDSHLQNPLAGVYLVFGREPFLVEETVDAVRAAARRQGIDERVRFVAEPGFDWNAVPGELMALSLFSGRRLIEVRIPGAGPGKDGAAVLKECASAATPDAILLVIAGVLDKAAQRGEWFKALDKAGVCVEIFELKPADMPKWVASRMRAAGLSFEPEVVPELCHRVEGNLAAAAQEIEKLVLAAAGRRIDGKTLSSLADQSRFDVYAFTNACLAGEADRSLRVLQRLRGEGVAPTLLIWALVRDTRLLLGVASDIANGATAQRALSKHRLWPERSRLVEAAVGRGGPVWWRAVLRRLALLDRVAKGRARPGTSADVWLELERVGLAICGIRLGTLKA